MDGFRYDIVFGIYFLEFNAGFGCNFDFGFNICNFDFGFKILLSLHCTFGQSSGIYFL